ncbi:MULTISPECIES: 3'-5' exonuclease [Pseudoalteromonas]|uniref:DNA polymerase III subunit epsilon n=1 Tax=Pseudoalteromonas aurantia 208 TaxID=1314867 RepID=A0ABR9EEL1_9GAMM|nr:MULTISPECIES: 3'-5' exonuclease [Pseudoalteromonas]MBE0369415.1 DNA polymerase III subunit epsilon [Pseudoalteromonas aurantia 208]MBQ4843958.1 3'-5' exonuclease [Pseudoalteromonas sp. MMG005]
MGLYPWLLRYLREYKLKQSYFDQQKYVIIDLELTGLIPGEHEIVSAAWLNMRASKIDLCTAGYMLNKEVQDLSQSTIYHGIDDDALLEGSSLRGLIASLATAINGHVLVCHNAVLDWGFIQRVASVYQYRITPKAIIDTMKIEKRRLLAQGRPLTQDSLTLSACRARYGLPEYKQHDALCDALATAELLLAQYSAISMGRREKLSIII